MAKISFKDFPGKWDQIWDLEEFKIEIDYLNRFEEVSGFDQAGPFFRNSSETNLILYPINRRNNTEDVYAAFALNYTSVEAAFENENFVPIKKKQIAAKLMLDIFASEYDFNKDQFYRTGVGEANTFLQEIYENLDLENKIKWIQDRIDQYNDRPITFKYLFQTPQKVVDELSQEVKKEYYKEDSRVASFLDRTSNEQLESVNGNPYVKICDYQTFKRKTIAIARFFKIFGFLLKRPSQSTIVRGCNYYQADSDLKRFFKRLEDLTQSNEFGIGKVRFSNPNEVYIYFEKDYSKIKFIYKKNTRTNKVIILKNVDDESYSDLTRNSLTKSEPQRPRRAITQNYFIENYEEIHSNIQIRMFGLRRKKGRKKIIDGLVRKHLLPPGARIEPLDCVSLDNSEGIAELTREIFIRKFGTEQANRLLEEDIARTSSQAIKEGQVFEEAASAVQEIAEDTGEQGAKQGFDEVIAGALTELTDDGAAAFGNKADEIAAAFKSIDPFSNFVAGDFTNILQTAAITAANMGFAAAAAEAGGALDPEEFIKKGLRKVIKGQQLIRLLQAIPPGALFALLYSLEVIEFTEDELEKIAPDLIQDRTGASRDGIDSLIEGRLEDTTEAVRQRAETRGPERFAADRRTAEQRETAQRNREANEQAAERALQRERNRADSDRTRRRSERFNDKADKIGPDYDDEKFLNWFEGFSQRNARRDAGRNAARAELDERRSERRARRDERQIQSGGGIPYRVNQYRQARLEGREQAADQRTSQEEASIIGGLMQEDSTRNQMFNISEESLGKIGAELREMEASGASSQDKAQYVISIIISDILTCESERQGELQGKVVDFVFDILGFDVIMEDFNDIAQFLNAWDARNIDFCNPPNVPFADFIYNFFIGNFDFSFGNIGDFLKNLFAKLLAALVRLIIGILAAIAFLILQAILEALNFLSEIEPCDILNFLRDFSFNVQTRMCEETNNEAKFGRALAEAMGKEAFAKICVQLLGEGTKPNDIRDISCAACSLLSPEQYLSFLSGNPDRETTNIVGNYIRTRNMQEPEQTQQFSECGDGRLPEGSIGLRTAQQAPVAEIGAITRDIMDKLGIFQEEFNPVGLENVFSLCPPEAGPMNRFAMKLQEGPLEGSEGKKLLEAVRNEKKRNIDSLFELLNNENTIENQIAAAMPPMLHPTNILAGHNQKAGVNPDDTPEYDASELPLIGRDEEPYGELVQNKFDGFFNSIEKVATKSAEKVESNIRKDYIVNSGGALAALNTAVLPVSPLSLFSFFGADPPKNFEELKNKFANLEPSGESMFLSDASSENIDNGLYTLNGLASASLLFKSNVDLNELNTSNTISNTSLTEVQELEYGMDLNFKFGKVPKQCKAYSFLTEEDTQSVIATLQQNPQIENDLAKNSSNVVYLREKIKNSLGVEDFDLPEASNIFVGSLNQTIIAADFLKTNNLKESNLSTAEEAEQPETGSLYATQLEKAFYKVGPHNVDFAGYSNQVSSSYFDASGPFSEEKTLDRFKPESPGYIEEYMYIHDSDLALLDATLEMYAMRSFVKTSGLLVNTILNIDSPMILQDSESERNNIIKAFYVQNVLDDLENDEILDEYIVISNDLEKIKKGTISKNSALYNIEGYLNKYLELVYLPKSKLAIYEKQLRFIEASSEEFIDPEDDDAPLSDEDIAPSFEALSFETLQELSGAIQGKIDSFNEADVISSGKYVKITDSQIFGFTKSGSPVNVISRPSFSVGDGEPLFAGNRDSVYLQKAYYAKKMLLNQYRNNSIVLNLNVKFKVKEKNNTNVFQTRAPDGIGAVLPYTLNKLLEVDDPTNNFEISINDFKKYIFLIKEIPGEIQSLLNNFDLFITLSDQVVIDGEAMLQDIPTWSNLSDGTYVMLDDDAGPDYGSFLALTAARLSSQPTNLTDDAVVDSKVFVEVQRKEVPLAVENLESITSLENVFYNYFNFKDHIIFYDFIFNLENITQFLTIYYASAIKRAEDSLARKSNFSQNRVFTNKYKNLGRVLKRTLKRVIN